MKDIDEIINEKNIIYKFEKIMQITNNIDSNEVIIIYKILNDINNQMSDYPNSFLNFPADHQFLQRRRGRWGSLRTHST